MAQDLNEASITDAVLESVRDAPVPRARILSEAAVRHLHGFIREVGLTEEEWKAGIDFLTETGHLCDNRRQEFILLSDALGASMLVDAINHLQPGEATETTVFGPFYVEDAPVCPSGSNIAGDLPGPPMLVTGSVRDHAGEPLPEATVDVWHADADGFYDVQYEGHDLAGRARFQTDADGAFHFWTVLPAAYPIPNDGTVGRMLKAQGRHPFRPSHIHFMLSAPGHQRLITHLFLENSEYLDSDVVFGVKDSLIRPVELHPAGETGRGGPSSAPYWTMRADLRLAAD